MTLATKQKTILAVRDSAKEVMSEGITRRVFRRWSELSDSKLLETAVRFVQENHIEKKNDLSKCNRGLYAVLYRRGLIDKIKFQKTLRNWATMENGELVGYAQNFINEKLIRNRYGLEKADIGLYHALQRRNDADGVRLIERLDFEEGKRKSGDWNYVSSKWLVEFGQNFIDEKEIRNKKGLEKANLGLYKALSKRKDEEGIRLIDRLSFKEVRRSWISISNIELAEHAQRMIDEKGISNRKEFETLDFGLYSTLVRRKDSDGVRLLDKLSFKKKRETRDWARMSDDILIEYAMEFIDKNEIKNKIELAKADPGLYQVLRKRTLIDSVFSNIKSARKQETEHRHLTCLSHAALAMEKFGEGEEG